MNERIKELAEQAENYAAEQNDKFGVSYKKTYNEKFAELIVKECILVIQLGITRDGTTTEKFQRSMKHIKQIKEHFGVKE